MDYIFLGIGFQITIFSVYKSHNSKHNLFIHKLYLNSITMPQSV